jgi:hypothetical protein
MLFFPYDSDDYEFSNIIALKTYVALVILVSNYSLSFWSVWLSLYFFIIFDLELL